MQYPHPEAFTVDHITPSSHGGSDHYEQLQPAHFRCNRTKSDGDVPGTIRRNSGALG